MYIVFVICPLGGWERVMCARLREFHTQILWVTAVELFTKVLHTDSYLRNGKTQCYFWMRLPKYRFVLFCFKLF